MNESLSRPSSTQAVIYNTVQYDQERFSDHTQKVAGRGSHEIRLTILSLGYFSQTFFNPSGEEIYAKRHVDDCGSASIHKILNRNLPRHKGFQD